MNKIIFSGAFDPIHLGHINMAKKASEYLNADVVFVPSPISVWKSQSAPIEHKRKMIEISIKDNPRFSIDDFEIKSGKQVNYSIDTVRYFKSKYPNDKLYFLIGTDQVDLFHQWKDADEIAKLVNIICFKRPGYDLDMNNVERFNMTCIPGEVIDISSTEIKGLSNLNLSYEVLMYIEDNELYFINKVKSYLTEKRFKHSISVANLSYIIAKKHNVCDSGYKAYIAGLLHDIGKDIDKAKAKEIMENDFSEFLDLAPFSYHQFIGSKIAHEDFNVIDENVLNAIKYHATGNSNMSELAKIIYAADKIEPTRGYDSTDLINAMMDDVNEGFKVVLKANKEFLESNRKEINNRLTLNCFNEYLK